MEINSFGEAKFIHTRKGLTGEIIAHGTIISINGETLQFKDNDEFVYTVRKDQFQFTPCLQITEPGLQLKPETASKS